MDMICDHQDIESEFWKHVKKRGELDCWLWIGRLGGGTKTHRYGGFHGNGRLQYAHRVAYELTNGQIPEGQNVMHTCDQPLCCNPRHLRLGTQAQNIRDMHMKGRARKAKGEAHGNAKLTKEQAIAIYNDPRSRPQIAKAFGIGITAVNNIKTGETWSHATGAEYRRTNRFPKFGTLTGHPAQGCTTAQIKAFNAVAEGAPRPKAFQGVFDCLVDADLLVEHVSEDWVRTYTVPEDVFKQWREWKNRPDTY